MKNLLIILLVVLISGCHLTKKVAKSEALTTQSAQTNETASAKENLKVNNNLVTDQETTTTITEFYPPDSIVSVDNVSNIVTVSVSNAVKSITTTTIKTTTRDQGTAETTIEQQAAKTIVDNSSSNVKTDDTEKPAPDPKRWMWICFILVILVGIFIYLKRSPIFTWVKSVLSPLSKIPKI